MEDKDKLIVELKAENARLKSCLQEIKAIAKMDICSNCITQKREDNCQCLADTILQLITKAERRKPMRSEDLETENIKLKKEIENEIKNTVDMERLARKNLQDFNNEYAKNKQYKKFVEYIKDVCSTRMTFENPNDDLKSCLNFIDRTFDDLLIRIKDLEIITGENQ